MTFPIPDKDKNPVCEECRTVNTAKHAECDHPCNWLVNWACHQATADICLMSTKAWKKE